MSKNFVIWRLQYIMHFDSSYISYCGGIFHGINPELTRYTTGYQELLGAANFVLHMVAFCRRFVYLLRFDFDIACVCTTFTTILSSATSSRRRLPNDPG